MAGVTVKLTADVSSFKKNINEAKATVKRLDEQLKVNEEQLKLNGDKEIYMQNKAGLLKIKLEAQTRVVRESYKALQKMKESGVDPSSTAFENMEGAVAKATAEMLKIKNEIKDVETNAGGAKKETNSMNTALKKIGKGVAFENLTSGLSEISRKLESAGRAAVSFGKKIARSFMDSTEWADDVMTKATMWGTDAETVQRMENVADIIDTDAETIIKAQDKLARNRKNVTELLGIDTTGMSAEDAFWAAGEALMKLSETMDDLELDETARKIFGTGWRELLPLLKTGRQEYEKLLGEQTVLTTDQVKSLQEADDQIKKMEQEVERLKANFWAENSQTIIDLLQWILDNKDAVVTAIGVIGAAFGMIKIGEFASNLGKVISGFKTLTGLGGGGGVVGTGGTGGIGGTGGTGVTGVGGVGGAATGKGLLAKALTAVKAGFAANGLWAFAPAAVLAAAVTPALIVEDKYKSIWRADQKRRLAEAKKMASANDENAKLVQSSAEVLGLALDENGNELTGPLGPYAQMTDTHYINLSNLQTRQGAERAKLQMALIGKTAAGNDAWEMLNRYWAGEEYGQGEIDELLSVVTDALIAQFEAGIPNAAIKAQQRKLPENYQYGKYGSEAIYDSNGKFVTHTTGWDDKKWQNWIDEHGGTETDEKLTEAASDLEAAAQDMTGLPDRLAEAVRAGMSSVNITIGGMLFGSHANGLLSVPWDGYPAILHKGERVLTAREADRYTTNNYFGNVNLNNGLEIEALTDSIDRRNRRQRSGYGA